MKLPSRTSFTGTLASYLRAKIINFYSFLTIKANDICCTALMVMAGWVSFWPSWHISDNPVSEKTHGSFKELTRYALVGIVSNFAGYLVYLLVTYLGSTPKVTMTVLYVLGAAIGYVGNRNFTFAHKGSLLGSGVRYFIAHCFGYFINIALLIIFVDHYGYAHQLVQAVAIFVVAIFLFVVFKFLVFTNINANMNRL